MDSSDKVLVNKESLESIQIKLRGLKVSLDDKNAQSVIGEILEILDNELKIETISIEQIIHDKMNETKYLNHELHFKLYMLYRKVVENKITEEEAAKAYELYLHD